MAKIQELAQQLSRKHKIQQKEAERFISLLIDVLNDGLHQEKIVKVKGLGTFKVINVKERESVNVNTGERILIEGRSKITFTPDTVMKELVNKPFAQFTTVPVNEGVSFEDISTEKEAEEEPETEEKEASAVVVPLAAAPETSQTITETQPEQATPAPKEEVIEPATPAQPQQDEVEETENSEDTEDKEASAGRKTWPLWLAAVVVVGALMFFAGYQWAGHQDLISDLLSKKDAPVVAADPIDKTSKTDTTSAAGADLTNAQQAETGTSAQDAKIANAQVEEQTAKKTEPGKQQSEQAARNAELSATNEKEMAQAKTIVRTGAYKIVGTQETVTVRKGQTLEKISKHYFGDGLAAYLMVHNGVTDVQEGFVLKIPKLQIKKR